MAPATETTPWTPTAGKLKQIVAGNGQTRRFSHHRPATQEKMGWPTGFEPATTRSTIWGSTMLSYGHHVANAKLEGRLPGVKRRFATAPVRAVWQGVHRLRKAAKGIAGRA